MKIFNPLLLLKFDIYDDKDGPSAELVDLLVALEDRPWFEWRRGKPLTQNSLSRLLKPYHITQATLVRYNPLADCLCSLLSSSSPNK